MKVEREREREVARKRPVLGGALLPHKQSPHTKYTLSRERTQEMGGRNREKLHGRVWAMERARERESERTNAAGEGAREGDESTTSANVNVAWRL